VFRVVAVVGQEHEAKRTEDVITENLSPSDTEEVERPRVAHLRSGDEPVSEGPQIRIKLGRARHFTRDDVQEVGLLPLHVARQDFVELDEPADRSRDQERESLACEGRLMGVVEAALEKPSPEGREMPIHNGAGEYEDICGLEIRFIELNKPVLVVVGTPVRRRAPQAAEAVSPDVDVPQVDLADITISLPFERPNHRPDPVAMVTTVVHDDDALAAQVTSLDGLAGGVHTVLTLQWSGSSWDRQSSACHVEDHVAERGEFLSPHRTCKIVRNTPRIVFPPSASPLGRRESALKA